MQDCQLVDSHKSTGSGPVRSPVSNPSKKSKNTNQKQKQPSKQKTHNNNKTKKQNTQKTPRSGIATSCGNMYNARTGRVLAQAGPEQEITPLPGIYFLMGGEYIQHWSSPPTYQAPKKHQYVMLKPPHIALQAQNHPGRWKKRRVTSSLPLLRTKRKMDPALVGQPSVSI